MSVVKVYGLLCFEKGKGPHGDFFFEGHEEKGETLRLADARKLAALVRKKASPDLALTILSEGFLNVGEQLIEGKKHEGDLAQLCQEIVSFIDKLKTERVYNAVESKEAVAQLLSTLAPKETPEELAQRLKDIAGNEKLLDEAVQHLQKCMEASRKANREERNNQGYILLRVQDPVKKAAQDAKRQQQKAQEKALKETA